MDLAEPFGFNSNPYNLLYFESAAGGRKLTTTVKRSTSNQFPVYEANKPDLTAYLDLRSHYPGKLPKSIRNYTGEFEYYFIIKK